MEKDFLRRSATCSRLEKMRNNVITETNNITTSALDYIIYKKLNWYGQIQRMEQEMFPRRILEWCPAERRRNGKPRNSWIQEVTEGMRVRGIGGLEWVDREGWKKKIHLL